MNFRPRFNPEEFARRLFNDLVPGGGERDVMLLVAKKDIKARMSLAAMKRGHPRPPGTHDEEPLG